MIEDLKSESILNCVRVLWTDRLVDNKNLWVNLRVDDFMAGFACVLCGRMLDECGV